MASTGTSPCKRVLLGLRRRNKMDKNVHDISNKRARSESPEVSKKAFMEACLRVSYKASQDFRKRFKVFDLPQSIQGDMRNGNIKQISVSAEQHFKMEMNTKTWCEALEVCLVGITPEQYLSPSMLKDIVEIILNAHEEFSSEYTIEYILRKCEHVLLLNFNMHPPSAEKQIRDYYNNFLTSPMDLKKNSFSNRQNYRCEEGFVIHCIERLMYELDENSRNDRLIDIEQTPEFIDKGVKELHWKKENLELFEFLTRSERIERLMLILEMVITLLQTDLAVWNFRRGLDGKRSLKPLLACVLWPKPGDSGNVTNICSKIIKLFVYFIHLQYPEEHINIMSIWMNVVIQLFYMNTNSTNHNYPSSQTIAIAFQLECVKIMSPLPPSSVLRVLERMPSIMQYVGIKYIEEYCRVNSDIISTVISCINDATWKKYPGKTIITPLKIYTEKKVEPHKLLDHLSEMCKGFQPKTVQENTYPKMQQTTYNTSIQRSEFLNIMLAILLAYLDAYSVKDFHQTYQSLKSLDQDQYVKECNAPLYDRYSVTPDLVKKYRSIVESLNTLYVTMKSKPNNEISKQLKPILMSYFT